MKKIAIVLLSVLVFLNVFTVSAYADEIRTVLDVLETYPGGFPSDEENGWENQTNTDDYVVSYINYHDGTLRSAKPYSDLALCDLDDENGGDGIVRKEGSDYIWEHGVNSITFHMNNEKLTSFTASGYQHSVDYRYCVGLYAPKKTIKDILPGNFPSSKENAWISDFGFLIYYDTTNHKIVIPQLEGISIPDNTVLKFDGSNYTCSLYEQSNLVANIKFEMNNDVLQKIVASNILDETIPNSTFEPLGDRKLVGTLISDYLSSDPSNSIWINDNGVKMFKETNSSFSLISFDGYDFNIPFTMPLSFSSPNYYFDVSEGNETMSGTFVIKNSKLHSIQLSLTNVLSSDTLNGTYTPYRITDGKGASIDVSTDNNLSFKCLADFSDYIGVKVDNNILASTSYFAQSGSTIVTLFSSFLKTLQNGGHTIEFLYNGDVSVVSTFTVTGSTVHPVPSPSSNISHNNHIVLNTGVK